MIYTIGRIPSPREGFKNNYKKDLIVFDCISFKEEDILPFLVSYTKWRGFLNYDMYLRIRSVDYEKYIDRFELGFDYVSDEYPSVYTFLYVNPFYPVRTTAIIHTIGNVQFSLLDSVLLQYVKNDREVLQKVATEEDFYIERGSVFTEKLEEELCMYAYLYHYFKKV